MGWDTSEMRLEQYWSLLQPMISTWEFIRPFSLLWCIKETYKTGADRRQMEEEGGGKKGPTGYPLCLGQGMKLWNAGPHTGGIRDSLGEGTKLSTRKTKILVKKSKR